VQCGTEPIDSCRFSAPHGVLCPQVSGQFPENWPLTCGRNTPCGVLNIPMI